MDKLKVNMMPTGIIKRCTTLETKGGDAQRRLGEIVSKDDVESLGLSLKDAQFSNKWRRKIKGQPVNSVSPGKWQLKWSVCYPYNIR